MDFNCIVGLDEVGRGSLSGPVVAAAVHIADFSALKDMKFGDSKSMSAKKREELFNFFKSRKEIKWGIGRVSNNMIDKINILEATKLAMRKALDDLDVNPDLVVIDGNFKIGLNVLELPVIKGDERIMSCRVASIIAKVTRDRLMDRYDLKYPEYGFRRNKGYGTKEHITAIKKHGYSKIHRKSFKIV